MDFRLSSIDIELIKQTAMKWLDASKDFLLNFAGNSEEFARNCYNTAEDFILDMTFELAHDYLFLSPNFPIFFIIQAIWICMTVRRNAPLFPWWKSLLITFSMSVAGKVLVAFFTKREFPLFANPYLIPIFAAVWFLVYCSPFDLFYRFCDFLPNFFCLQFANIIVDAREATHGVDLGLRAFPASVAGAIATSVALSSAQSLIWLLFYSETREYSMRAIAKNFAFALAYFSITQYPEVFTPYIDTSREFVKIVGLCLLFAVGLVDDVIFGLRGTHGVDPTLLTYVFKLLPYSGAK